MFIRMRPPATIADIAYDRITRSRTTDFRIFIQEDGRYVPYLVLTANYGGNVLLLREYVMDETRPINHSPNTVEIWSGETLGIWAWQDYGAYYPNSYMDNFLNAEFKDTLCDSVIAAMVPSNIVVTAKDSIGPAGRDSYNITRYVFLLSRRELGVPSSNIAVPEGERLRFFRNYHARRVASFSDSTAMPYWTRTPNTLGTSSVFFIGINMVDFDTADICFGIRPAFAMCRSTAITTSTDIVSGQTVFVLDTGNAY